MYTYNMTASERVQWEKLTNTVKSDFAGIDTGDIPRETVQYVVSEMTRANEPGYASRGFVADEGYYMIYEGDRGSVDVIFEAASFATARYEIIKQCAHDISYRFVNDNMERLERQNKSKWHYIRVRDGIEKVDGLERMAYYIEEQTGWIYDLEYDYRKYWFDSLIHLEKDLLPADEYEAEVKKYEDYLNYGLPEDGKRWKYNRVSEKFGLF